MKVKYISKSCRESNSPQQAFGAPNMKVYLKWYPEVCGICCLKMVGDTLNKTNHASLYQLTMQGLNIGVYKEQDDGSIQGAFHKPLINLAKEYGIKGNLEKRLSSKRIIELIEQHKFPILSVDRQKINPQLTPGGHLILIHTWDQNKNAFLIHDPEPLLADNGENITITLDLLDLISNHKGFSLW